MIPRGDPGGTGEHGSADGVIPVTPYPDVPAIYFRESCLSSDKVA